MESMMGSLYRKLIVAFIAVGFFPFLIFFIYSISLSQQKIIDKIIVDQNIEAQRIIDSIHSHLEVLQKEIRFISSLDLMDDIIAEDIDKRISRLLTQKQEDIGLNLEIFVVDNNAHIVASSNKESIDRSFVASSTLTKEGYFFEGEHLYLYAQVDASFHTDKHLGYLILRYDLEDLKTFFSPQSGTYNILYNPKTQLKIGASLPFEIDLATSAQIDSRYLIINKKMAGILSDFYIIYGEDKDIALAFLYDLIFFIIMILPLALIVTVLIAHYNTKSILKPILELTNKAETITKTKNYNISMDHVGTKDEIGRLSFAFNEMIQTTHDALVALEEENRLRLKRFVSLIEIFNKIIQTKEEEECIQSSLREFEHLSDKELVFNKNLKENKQALHIYLNDFEKNEKSYFGSIELDVEAFEDENEKKFYTSIVSMITLQLERIRLIDRTISASKAKSAFISNMSHELRTPLNAIIGFTQYLLAYEELEDEQQDIVSNIEKSAHYLLNMINEVLDIAKIEAGKMEVHQEAVAMKSLLDEVYMMGSVLAQEKELSLTLEQSELRHEVIQTDPKLLKQILLNIISNAIKFTPKGSVLITAKSEEHSILICVKDSGIGLSKENLERLFSDFIQVENEMHKKYKGTGLGLSLSRKLARLLGGELVLQSEGEGKGSEAILRLEVLQESDPYKNNT